MTKPKKQLHKTHGIPENRYINKDNTNKDRTEFYWLKAGHDKETAYGEA